MVAELPEWIIPMAATLTEERFTGPEWIFERKIDGIRLLAYKRGADVRLYSRNRLPQDLPGIAQAIAALPVGDAILDGELSWDGTRYDLFDVMWWDGRETMSRPLLERHTLLSQLPLVLPLARVEELPGTGSPTPFERAAREGWEGVVAKRCDSVYEQRRSRHWLKMKCEATQELVVGGFTEPQGTRVGLGALLVGYYEQQDLVFAGKVGTGFDAKLLVDLRARLDAIHVADCPFTSGTGLPRTNMRWARPEIVIQVAFVEWTRHGKLRHPRLLAVRFDKDPRDVVRES